MLNPCRSGRKVFLQFSAVWESSGCLIHAPQPVQWEMLDASAWLPVPHGAEEQFLWHSCALPCVHLPLGRAGGFYVPYNGMRYPAPVEIFKIQGREAVSWDKVLTLTWAVWSCFILVESQLFSLVSPLADLAHFCPHHLVVFRTVKVLCTCKYVSQ